MFSILARIFRVVFSKAAVVVALWLVVIGVTAAWLYGKSKYDELPEKHRRTIEKLRSVEEARKLAERKATNYREKLRARQGQLKARAEYAEAKRQKILEMKAKLSGLLGIFASEETKRDLAVNQAELARAEKDISALSEEVTELQSESASAKKELTELTEETGALEKEAAETKKEISYWEKKRNGAWYWIKRAFGVVGVTLVVVTVAILVLPFLFRVLLYFVIAPLMSVARPIRIHTGNFRAIDVSETSVAKEVELAPGEFAIIKPQFYQASDERLQKRTKFVFDWRFPFTSAACGLIEMTRVVNNDPDRRALTLSSQDEAEVELAVISVPEDGSVIMRPRYLAGFVGAEGKPPRIRTHWKLFSLHSWLTLQFRYFEFEGPSKLAVWALRGVRAEKLTKRDIEQKNRKRTNQDATIGFTPTLKYHSTRAETFWAYFRGQNPLFDDIFTGEGTFLCQQVSRAGRGGAVRRFWEALWNGFTKIFGI